MNTPTPVPPPTRDPGPIQWSEADLALARIQNRNEDIVRAHEAGQLSDLMARGHSVGHDATPSRGGTMTPDRAAQVIATPPPGTPRELRSETGFWKPGFWKEG